MSVRRLNHTEGHAMPETKPAPARRPRIQLVIRCTGRKVNPLTFRAEGRVCGRRFTSAGKYRSRADWIERARAAGWRVSPLHRDKTVIACCPPCNGTAPKKKKKRKEPT